MARRSARKQDKQRKRNKRKLDAARKLNVNPFRLAGQRGETVACYINEGWDEQGMASMYVLRRTAGHGIVMASFLVDTWCAGLKDAWGRLDMTLGEFEEQILDRIPEEVQLTRIEIDEVRRLVAGGIRFARQNGFRLPSKYDRWVAVLGGECDPDHSDLTGFGVDGGLRYVGTLEDLKRRLIGCSVDDFLGRKDIEFELMDSNFSLVNDEEIEFDGMMEDVRSKITEAARKWCFAKGYIPSPALGEATDILLESLAQASTRGDDDEATLSLEAHSAREGMSQLLSLTRSAEDRAQLLVGLEALHEFIAEFSSPEAFLNACGITAMDMQ